MRRFMVLTNNMVQRLSCMIHDKATYHLIKRPFPASHFFVASLFKCHTQQSSADGHNLVVGTPASCLESPDQKSAHKQAD
jgi:hypothetical protein